MFLFLPSFKKKYSVFVDSEKIYREAFTDIESRGLFNNRDWYYPRGNVMLNISFLCECFWLMMFTPVGSEVPVLSGKWGTNVHLVWSMFSAFQLAWPTFWMFNRILKFTPQYASLQPCWIAYASWALSHQWCPRQNAFQKRPCKPPWTPYSKPKNEWRPKNPTALKWAYYDE